MSEHHRHLKVLQGKADSDLEAEPFYIQGSLSSFYQIIIA